MVCYIRKYVTILGGVFPLTSPHLKILGDVSPASPAGLTPWLPPLYLTSGYLPACLLIPNIFDASPPKRTKCRILTTFFFKKTFLRAIPPDPHSGRRPRPVRTFDGRLYLLRCAAIARPGELTGRRHNLTVCAIRRRHRRHGHGASLRHAAFLIIKRGVLAF